MVHLDLRRGLAAPRRLARHPTAEEGWPGPGAHLTCGPERFESTRPERPTENRARVWPSLLSGRLFEVRLGVRSRLVEQARLQSLDCFLRRPANDDCLVSCRVQHCAARVRYLGFELH